MNLIHNYTRDRMNSKDYINLLKCNNEIRQFMCILFTKITATLFYLTSYKLAPNLFASFFNAFTLISAYLAASSTFMAPFSIKLM